MSYLQAVIASMSSKALLQGKEQLLHCGHADLSCTIVSLSRHSIPGV